MTFLSSARRILNFLAIAKVLGWWDALFYALLLLAGAFVASVEGDANGILLALFLIAPIFAGTGLLSVAREGHLDLLFGAGVSRFDVWTMAFLRLFLMPLCIIAGCSAWWLRNAGGSGVNSAGRAIAVGTITLGIAFALGLVRPRYAAGVIWCFVRVAFLLSSAGRGLYMQIAHPDQAGGIAPAWQEFIALLAYPELLLYASVRAVVVIAALGMSFIGMYMSLRRFRHADFGGHRAS